MIMAGHESCNIAYKDDSDMELGREQLLIRIDASSTVDSSHRSSHPDSFNAITTSVSSANPSFHVPLGRARAITEPMRSQAGGFVNLSARPTRQTLPQLAIPDQPQSTTPREVQPDPRHQSEAISETPTSLSSPIVRVVDLTKSLRTTSIDPVIHGGFSDIYRGEWERECGSESALSSGDRKVEVVQVAIKLLRVLSSKGYDEVKARKRLNREVYVWHRLEHPNIATFLGTSYHMSGRPSLVLPWFKNGSASDYLKQNLQADRIKLILDVAKGLEYLHTLKPAPIVHGDLKGNNILITDDGHAILTDFGLSQVIEDLVGPGITPSQAGGGPIRWQAPESLMDESCCPKMSGDVWSFGCTAYELLTGNVPYHFRLRDAQVIQDIQNGVKPPGKEEFLEYQGSGGGIWDLLNDCWSAEPCERITMTEVVSRLRDICHCSPPSFSY